MTKNWENGSGSTGVIESGTETLLVVVQTSSHRLKNPCSPSRENIPLISPPSPSPSQSFPSSSPPPYIAPSPFALCKWSFARYDAHLFAAHAFRFIWSYYVRWKGSSRLLTFHHPALDFLRHPEDTSGHPRAWILWRPLITVNGLGLQISCQK